MDKRKKLILILLTVIAAISIAALAVHAMYAPQPSSGCITQPGGGAICPVTTTPLG